MSEVPTAQSKSQCLVKPDLYAQVMLALRIKKVLNKKLVHESGLRTYPGRSSLVEGRNSCAPMMVNKPANAYLVVLGRLFKPAHLVNAIV